MVGTHNICICLFIKHDRAFVWLDWHPGIYIQLVCLNKNNDNLQHFNYSTNVCECTSWCAHMCVSFLYPICTAVHTISFNKSMQLYQMYKHSEIHVLVIGSICPFCTSISAFRMCICNPCATLQHWMFKQTFCSMPLINHSCNSKQSNFDRYKRQQVCRHT